MTLYYLICNVNDKQLLFLDNDNEYNHTLYMYNKYVWKNMCINFLLKKESIMFDYCN